MTAAWKRSNFLAGLLAGCLVVAGMPASMVLAQSSLALTVEDSHGDALVGASVLDGQGRLFGRTGEDGRAEIACQPPCAVRVQAQGFAEQKLTLSADLTLRLQPAAATEQVSVTAYRAPLGLLASPAATRILSNSFLNASPSLTLDGEIRQIPGLELFRRSSSLVANPSSQGLSLRGLGSTSASRTLLTRDDVPLNDPVGGWIHWEEQPELTVQSVEAVRGGASDLYGSSAIGGVVNVLSEHPVGDELRLRSSFGGMGTFDVSVLGQVRRHNWGLIGSGGALGTNGFIQQAPWLRGPVDQPSSVHAANGLGLIENDRGAFRLFSSVSGFNEARDNGTDLQRNATRIWRYTAGLDWQGTGGQGVTARAYGSDERFDQTFTSISNKPIFGDPSCGFRCGENPMQSSSVPDNEAGMALRWNRPLGREMMMVLGGDLRDVRVWDQEQIFGSKPALTSLAVHQRNPGIYAESLWSHKQWTLAASARLDWFQNFDQRQWMEDGSGWTLLPAMPSTGLQTPFDPRVGVARRLGTHWALTGSAFRAFRAPTPNELYRSTQVGNKLTNPNGLLKSERATGWEAGAATQWDWGTLRASYFDTQVNRPITAVTVNLQSSPVLLERENLGQIESRGFSSDFEIRPLNWLTADGGYQHAHATVTSGTQDLGNWIPEVARNMGTLGLRAYKPDLGLFRLESRFSGRQYDDDANLFPVRGYTRIDAYASRDFGRRFQLFAAGENLANRQIQVSDTPGPPSHPNLFTLGTPRLLRGGMEWRLDPPAKPAAGAAKPASH